MGGNGNENQNATVTPENVGETVTPENVGGTATPENTTGTTTPENTAGTTPASEGAKTGGTTAGSSTTTSVKSLKFGNYSYDELNSMDFEAIEKEIENLNNVCVQINGYYEGILSLLTKLKKDLTGMGFDKKIENLKTRINRRTNINKKKADSVRNELDVVNAKTMKTVCQWLETMEQRVADLEKGQTD